MTTSNLLEMELDSLSLTELENIDGGSVWSHIALGVAGFISAFLF